MNRYISMLILSHRGGVIIMSGLQGNIWDYRTLPRHALKHVHQNKNISVTKLSDILQTDTMQILFTCLFLFLFIFIIFCNCEDNRVR